MDGQGISAGDVVLRFLGDTTSVDGAFDHVVARAKDTGDELQDVGSKAEASFAPVGDAAEEAGERVSSSMGEARGEVALLGEEFGIRLPRHVRTFVAELPGVQGALSAAFGATAVLFLAQALVQGSEKLSQWIADSFIYTEAMKKMEGAVKENNKTFLAQAVAIEAAKEALEDYGKDKVTQLEDKLNNLNQTADEQKKKVAELTHYTQLYGNALGAGATSAQWYQDKVMELKAAENALSLTQLQSELVTKQLADLRRSQAEEAIKLAASVKETTLNLQEAQWKALVAGTENEGQKVLSIEQQFDEKRLQLKVKTLQQEISLEKQSGDGDKAQKVEKLEAEIERIRAEYAQKYFGLLAKEKDELAKTFEDMSKTVKSAPTIDIITPKAVQNILDGVEAAKKMSITLRQDLVVALQDAKKAQEAFAESGIKDAVAAKAFAKAIVDADKKLRQFGHDEDLFKAKTETTFQGAVRDINDGAHAMQNLGGIGVQAFNQLSAGLQSAIQAAILSQGSFSSAMKKMTEDALASIASQALVKALFYTAEGFAMEAGFLAGNAALYFEAAGIMAGVGAAAGVAAHAMSGGGSQTQSTLQANNSLNTSSNAPLRNGSSVSVQQFAAGGLVSAPTLAVMGESNRAEAVLPLEDPRAMATIGKAMAQYGGGGVTIHNHIEGVISHDVLSKVMKQMSKAVRNGRGELMASNSLRLTKRSA